jgi:hypothetical protein
MLGTETQGEHRKAVARASRPRFVGRPATGLLALTLLALLAAPTPATAAAEEVAEPFLQARLISEFGFLIVADHEVQFGKSGSRFDYVDEGGQDNLFFFMRHSAEVELDSAHAIVFLYQPLNLETRVEMERDVVIDGRTFPAGTPTDLRYGFDFYRLSYLYDLLDERPDDEVSLGLSLQLRNATIDFTSADGELRRTNRDIGPVPLIKLRGRAAIGERGWLGAEVDGIWAPIKYINGSSSDVEGALVDLSLRGGYEIARSLDLFVNVRYLFGGAEGTSSEDEGPGDGYVSNWLHFVTISVGLEWTPTDL